MNLPGHVFSSAGRLLGIAVLCTVIFFFRSGALPFLGADEPRYTRIAEEMRSSGDWILPHLEGKPWLEKPPLLYWLTALGFSLLGSGEAQARLVSAGSMALVTATIYFFGKCWFSAQAGWIGALIFVSSSAATGFSRAASMDALFTGLVFLGVCAFGQAIIDEKRVHRLFYLALSGICLGLSVLAKGLIGAILPGIVLLFFLIWVEAWKRLSWIFILLWGLLILAVSIPWHWIAFQRGGFDFLAIYLVNHHLARFFTEIHHHTQPIYYYLVILPAGLLPWTLLLPLLIKGPAPRIPKERLPESQRLAWLLMTAWILFLLGFFSLSASKLPGYILPACPPLALLIGARCAEWEYRSEGKSLLHRLLAGTALLMMGLGLLFSVLLYRYYGLPWATAALCGGGYVLGGLILLAWLRKKTAVSGYTTAFLITAATHALLVIQLSYWAFSAIGLRHSTRDLAGEALVLREANEPFYSYRCFHHTLAYYSQYRWQGNLEKVEELRVEAAKIIGGSILLMTEERWIPEIERAPGFRIQRLGRYGPRILVRLLLINRSDQPGSVRLLP